MVSINILIVYGDSIRMSADNLIASANALIVAEREWRNVEYRKILSLPYMLFFLVRRRLQEDKDITDIDFCFLSKSRNLATHYRLKINENVNYHNMCEQG